MPYSAIRNNAFRKDYRLAIEKGNETTEIMRDAVTLLEPFYIQALGADPYLVEHSALFTYENAEVPQEWHSDTGVEEPENLGK